MVYFATFDLNKKDKDTLMKSIDTESHRLILQNMEYLDPLLAESKKFKRRLEEMSADQFNDYARKLSSSNFEILRSEPEICKLIRQAHDNTVDQKLFPYIEKPKAPKKTRDVKKKGAQANSAAEFQQVDVLENPRIFVFVFGGLSHHEVSAISNLQETLRAQIIPGANEIISCKEFLKQLENLHRKETDS